VAGLFGQQHPQGRQGEPASAPFEQRLADTLFEQLEAAGQGRLGDADGFGRGMQGAAIDHAKEPLQKVGVAEHIDNKI